MNNKLILNNGIFSGEAGERTLIGLIKFTTQAFGELYEQASSKQYLNLLGKVSSWSSRLIYEQVSCVSKEAPDMIQRIDNSYKLYVSELFKQLQNEPPPTADEILREFLVQISKTSVIKDGLYFQEKNTVLARIVTMESFRQGLFAICNKRHVDDDIAPTDSASNL